MQTLEELINSLIARKSLKTPRIIRTFRKIDRADFVKPEMKEEAYVDVPLSIGYGQTISQPMTVAFMLELLQVEPGNKVLDIGAGSGWQTAILAHLVGPKGKVFAVERIPELKDFGETNLAKYNFLKKRIVELILGDGSKGLPKKSPFNRIIAAASAEEIPLSWKRQLKSKGRLVAPVGNSIWLLVKDKKGKIKTKKYGGFSFVPLVKGS